MGAPISDVRFWSPRATTLSVEQRHVLRTDDNMAALLHDDIPITVDDIPGLTQETLEEATRCVLRPISDVLATYRDCVSLLKLTMTYIPDAPCTFGLLEIIDSRDAPDQCKPHLERRTFKIYRTRVCYMHCALLMALRLNMVAKLTINGAHQMTLDFPSQILAAFAQCTRLLDVSGADFGGPAFARAIATAPNIRCVEMVMDFTEEMHAAVRLLLSVPTLRTIDISYADYVTDAHLMSLQHSNYAGLMMIRYRRLNPTEPLEIPCICAAALSRVVAGNPHMRGIRVEHVVIGDCGMLATVVAAHRHLLAIHLDLFDDTLGIDKFAEAFDTNRTILYNQVFNPWSEGDYLESCSRSATERNQVQWLSERLVNSVGWRRAHLYRNQTIEGLAELLLLLNNAPDRCNPMNALPMELVYYLIDEVLLDGGRAWCNAATAIYLEHYKTGVCD